MHFTPPQGCRARRLYVPHPLHQAVLDWVHNSLGSGHPGISTTQCLIAKKYWWPVCCFLSRVLTTEVNSITLGRPPASLACASPSVVDLALYFIMDLPSSSLFIGLTHPAFELQLSTQLSPCLIPWAFGAPSFKINQSFSCILGSASSLCIQRYIAQF